MWRSSIVVHVAVSRLRTPDATFYKIFSIIIVVFVITNIFALLFQKNDDSYFEITPSFQNYYHYVQARTYIDNMHLVQYNDKILGIEILIPQQWISNHKDNDTLYTADPNLVQFFSPQNDAQLFVTVYPLPSSNMSIDAYDKQYNLYSSDPTIHNLVLANATLSGMPAHQATFTLNYSGKSYQVVHVWTIKNDHVYKLSFSAYNEAFNKYSSSIEIMLNSFNVMR
jgi:hypothetical protein